MSNQSNFEVNTKKYEAWLRQHNVKYMRDMSIKDLRHKKEGRGVIALEDIKQGDIVFEIPRPLILNIETSTLVQDRPDIIDKLHNLNQWEALIIVLLYELKVKGQQSLWYTYFQVLPIVDKENYECNQLMFWKEEELKELHPSLVVKRIGKDLADGMYRKLFPKIVIDQMQIQELSDVTLMEYHEIASLIMAYSFDIEKLNSKGYVNGEESDESDEDPEDNALIDDEFSDSLRRDTFLKALIPLADTLNANTELHNASIEYKGDKLVIRAIKDIKSGEQIYNTYSNHPNSELLRRYGYVEMLGLKHDFGEIPLETIKHHFTSMSFSESFFDEIMDIFNKIIAHEAEADNDVQDIVLDSYDCFISGDIIVELIIILQCLTTISLINDITPMDSLQHESKFQLIKRIYHKCIQLIESRKLTKQFLNNYQQIIKSRINEYPPFAVDEFSHDVKNNRNSMAKVVLRSEYQSLCNCLDNEQTFKINDDQYQFIDDDKLVRNIIKRKFDLPIANESITKKPKK